MTKEAWPSVAPPGDPHESQHLGRAPGVEFY